MTEEEIKKHIKILYKRINELDATLNYNFPGFIKGEEVTPDDFADKRTYLDKKLREKYKR